MKIKKIIKLFLLLVLAAFITFFLKFIFDSYYYRYTTHETTYNNKYPSFIKTELKQKLKSEYFMEDRFGDSIYYYNYDKIFKLIVWKIKKYDLVTTPNIETIKANVTAPKTDFKGSMYTNIFGRPQPFCTLSVKAKMSEPVKLKVETDAYSKIDTIIQFPTSIYYSLYFDEIAIYGDEALDIVVYKMPHFNNSNIMILKYKGSFFLVFLSSLNNDRIKNDELLKIINLNSIQ